MHSPLEAGVSLPITLAFANDGEFATEAGIACVVRGIAHRLPESCWPAVEQVWIVEPESAVASAATWLSSLFPTLLFKRVVAPTKPDDRYYIQLGLSEVFERLPESMQVLCLDYDHLVDGHTILPDLSDDDTVYVSSEPGAPLSSLLGNRPGRSANASFLFGRASMLRRIGQGWYSAYEDLVAQVAHRHRSEIAFSLAAMEVGVRLTPAHQRVQGSFAVPDHECVFFHYGGDTAAAMSMKALLTGWVGGGRERGGVTLEQIEELESRLYHLSKALLGGTSWEARPESATRPALRQT